MKRALLLILLIGCGQNNQRMDSGVDMITGCTNPSKCCPDELLVCIGDPDTTITCTCSLLWECDTPSKCSQLAPTPNGSSSWKCTWEEFGYKCVDKSGNQTSSNKPTISWGKNTNTVPYGYGQWDCNWNSSEVSWSCVNSVVPNPSNNPDGIGFWKCYVEEFKLKCDKKEINDSGVDSNPEKECDSGQRKWCDGLSYCGWGIVQCENGKWKTKNINGKNVLDCQESLAGGRVPKTKCGCYHFYANLSCCEREDCIIPDGESGQLCDYSKPRGLCDYCNPDAISANTGSCGDYGACIVTDSHETFCGKNCYGAQDCPEGYDCLVVSYKNTPKQCIPQKKTCL